ncbi:Na+/H+ antiporter subunit E [Mesorhizobium sp. ZMM04-5]|uniref:Na+/H+ antiporter subunit E n=1 Tax=Mesorhizobium marinum TaxID=3228790 RepID=A0ABV3R187_9HYPH
MSRYTNIILLALVWAALTGSFTLPSFAFGLLLGWLALYVVREQLEGRDTYRRSRYRGVRIVSLAVMFVKELVLSGWRVAVLVLSPRMNLKPGIFAYQLKVDSDFEITLLANMITLTPGTLSVDVSPDRRTLYVHAIDCSDVEKAQADIRNGFERKTVEAFR